jgi:L-glyceraldehyde 3-phosphate reductase
MGVRALIHQPSYSILNRRIEQDALLDATAESGMGCIAFSPLQQGLLTSRYLDGTVPAGSRASIGRFLSKDAITPELLTRLRGLNELAGKRGQTLAQMATQWVVRDPRMTSALIGASSVAQLEENVAAVSGAEFSDEELAAIDELALG